MVGFDKDRLTVRSDKKRLSRKVHFHLWLVYVIFILYGTSLPFKINICQASARWHLFLSESAFKQHVSLPDVLSNIAIFVPFGFLLSFLPASRTGILVRLLVSVLVSALFSTCVEIWQFFLPSRTPSIIDVLANSTGALVGACCQTTFSIGSQMPATDRIIRILVSRPLTSVLGGFLAAQLLGALFPFDVSIDVSGVKERIKNSNFGSLTKQKFRSNFDWQDSLSQTLWYVPPGILLILCHSRERNSEKRRVWYCIIAFAVAFPFAAEILKLLESSGVFDINRGVAGTIGILAGIGFGLLTRERWQFSHVLSIVILNYLLNIVISEWLPFEGISKKDVVAAKWAHFELFPFGSYYEKTTLWSVKDFFATVLLTVPLGIYLGWKRGSSVLRTNLQILVLGLSLGIVLEVGQVYIRGRFPGVTDIISLTAGVMIGSYLFGLRSEMASKLMP